MINNAGYKVIVTANYDSKTGKVIMTGQSPKFDTVLHMTTMELLQWTCYSAPAIMGS